jgi:hypothetical protein
MFSIKSKPSAYITAGLLGLGLPVYGVYSMRSHLDERMSTVEHELQVLRAQDATKIQELSSDLKYMAEKLAVTTEDLEQARKLTDSLKQENVQSTQRLRSEIASHTRAVSQLRQQTSAVQQETTTKLGAVTGEVQNVRGDLDVTKTDLAANRKEIADVRDTLTSQIAHNSSELAELRKRGERNYIEFDIEKSRDMERIADVKVQLKKTDPKKQRFDLVLLVDDNKIERHDRVANEPLIFVGGRERVRYELVVNSVDKNRIRGYLSTPKDKLLSAEGPAFRPQK